MRILDTDVLIDVQRGHSGALEWFTGLTEVPSVPGIVVMELIQGATNSRQLKEAQRLTAPLPVVWPTVTDFEAALSNFVTFHLSHGLGLLDSIIASVALGLDAELCTFNLKHYRVIAGLRIVEPYTR